MTNQSASAPAAMDVGRAAATAAEYDALQGYAWMVLGAGLLVGAATGMEAVSLGIGGAMAGVVPSWYHRRYGVARPTRARSVKVVVGTLGAFTLLVAAFFLDRYWQPPVLITMLTLAAVLGVGQHLMLRRTGLTAVHFVVYAVVAIAAAAPLLGLVGGGAIVPYGLSVAGLALMVTGLVDHRRLVRILGPVTEDTARESRR